MRLTVQCTLHMCEATISLWALAALWSMHNFGRFFTFNFIHKLPLQHYKQARISVFPYTLSLIHSYVLVHSRVSQKTLFLNFASSVESLVRMGVQRPQKFFQRYRPINDTWPLIFSIQGDIQGRISKNRFLATKSCRNMLQPSS